MMMALMMCFIVISFGQTNFKWEKTDSIQKTKSQIYSDTKMFIAQTWKSAQAVIQNDDKEAGNILIKGVCKITVQSGGGYLDEYYDYTVSFKMKDNKYKIIIDNVYGSNSIVSRGKGGPYPVIKIFEGSADNCTQTAWITGVTKNKAVEVMSDLKRILQSIVNDYDKYIKTPSANSDW